VGLDNRTGSTGSTGRRISRLEWSEALDRKALDRRLFVTGLGLGLVGLSGLDALAGSDRTDRFGWPTELRTAADMTESAGGNSVLEQLSSDLRGIVASNGSVPPAQTAVAAWSLERQVGVMSRWRIPPAQRTAWQALHARVLVLEGNALIDVGDTAYGTRAIETAELLATRIGDWPTVAHTFAVRAMVARGRGDLPAALSLARVGRRYAGRSPVAVMLSVAEASATARMGHVADTREILDRGARVMARLPDSAHGNPGYSLDSYHPAQFALMAASALVLAKDVAGAEPFLRTARAAILPAAADGPGRPGGQHCPGGRAPGSVTSAASGGSVGRAGGGAAGAGPGGAAPGSPPPGRPGGGLCPLLRVISADAALNGPRPDVDKARAELTAAVADGRDRPSAWLASEVLGLTKVAAAHGADLSGLVDEVRGWAPGARGRISGRPADAGSV
jgi:hypothetical protein